MITTLIFNNKFHNDFDQSFCNYWLAKDIGWFEQIKSQIVNKIVISTLNRMVIAKILCILYFNLRMGPRISFFLCKHDR